MVILWNPWNVLTRMRRNNKGQILYIADRADQFATAAKLLDINTSLMASVLIK